MSYLILVRVQVVFYVLLIFYCQSTIACESSSRYFYLIKFDYSLNIKYMKLFTHYIADLFDKANDFIEDHFWTIICIVLFIAVLNYYCTPNP